jgi:hypothetical protein
VKKLIKSLKSDHLLYGFSRQIELWLLNAYNISIDDYRFVSRSDQTKHESNLIDEHNNTEVEKCKKKDIHGRKMRREKRLPPNLDI